MISLAITTGERTEMTVESFKRVLGNDYIDDIVIVDDCSNMDVFLVLEQMIKTLDNGKVRLIRNSANLKPYRNKYLSVKYAKNDWVILLDSDNIIDNDYVDIAEALVKQKDTIYCPSLLLSNESRHVLLNYGEYSGVSIDKETVKRGLGTWRFETIFNTSNYLLPRQEYLRIWETIEIDEELSKADTCYFSYCWLLACNKMFIVPGMTYIHRVHPYSWYLNNANDYDVAIVKMMDMLKNG